ncbi:metallophosphoesterase [Deinococcus sp. QL22]|uniref:metallophosphoesterase family protein n=1 Tax=Deinococcus sp. QL22 TaxID=2939437 RepID=UPI002017F09D|nr:metallophosphoesterase family protein [Deinococcus sp. QL22]UQN06704.1 metallophosphatase family protein [Deinococcus sp. QL22]
MRLAILSDVHGNSFALRAVLKDVQATSPDALYNLGDTVWGASDPATAWALQAEFAPPTVRGNTDERMAGMRAGKDAMRGWVASQLPNDLAAQLGQLPTFVDVAGGEVRLAHGSPRDPWEALMLSGEEERPATPAELRERLGKFAGAVCVVGHTHQEMLRVQEGVSLVNAGPVSRQKDGLPVARWLLLTRQNAHWNIEFRRTPYDVQAAAAWARANAPTKIGEDEAAWLLAGQEP